MELLSEVTINATLHRVSTDWQQLENLWEPKVAEFTPTKFGMAKEYGGYARPRWGSRVFSPDLFDSDWPPPKKITVKDMLTESDEASAVTVFEGTLHLDNFNEESVAYNSYGAEYTNTATGAVYSGTLSSIFTTACTTLGLTLDETAARASSPNVSYTATGEKMLLDNLSDMAAFFTHAFYIENETLHLIDLLLDNGTSTLDEFGYFRGSEYRFPTPYSLFKAGNFHQDGSYRYGEELDISPVCHSTQSNIETALSDIKTVMEYERCRFKVIPEADKLPVIGQKVTVTNESLQSSTSTWIRVTDYAPDILGSEIMIEGFGVST